MKRIFCLSLIVLQLSACRKVAIEATSGPSPIQAWQDSSNIHPRNAVYKNLLEKYYQKGLPGISLLVNDQYGTWIGSIGKADLEHDINFETGQVSKIASVTKLMVGALVFRLFEDSAHSGLSYNSLSLPITTWIPHRLTDKISNGNEVTLGQLLKHESGIPDVAENNTFYLDVMNDPTKNWSPEELLKMIEGVPAIFKPGDTAIYSNTNTILVSMIIEASTGRKHGDLLKEEIFAPLGMTHTYYQPYDPLPANTAQGYFDLYNNKELINVSNITTGSGNGFGGVFSNIFDMYKFIDALLVKKTLLSVKSLDIMQTFGKSDGTNRYGYGIMKKFIERGENAGLGHSGRDLGYTANLLYFPSKHVSHALLINYGTDNDSFLKKVFQDFQNELLDITLQ